MTWSAFFDESGTHHESEWIVLAGYIFDDEQFSALDRKWKGMLESSKDSEGKSLPYFRMSDCAHNTGAFKNFTALQCDRIAREAISLITDHKTFGFAVSIDKTFAHLIPREELYDSPYSFALLDVFVVRPALGRSKRIHRRCGVLLRARPRQPA